MALTFVDPVLPTDARPLSPLQRAQLLEAGRRYDRVDLSPEARLDPTRPAYPEDEDEGASFAGSLEIWRVLDGDTHRFDALLYMADSGTVFRAGTTEVVAERIQVDFQSDLPGLEDALNDALQEAYVTYRDTLRAAHAALDGALAAYQRALQEAYDRTYDRA